MKMRYLVFIAIFALAFLSGCQNRFNDFEPTSAFDDRMASADRPPMTPDDQMPPMDSQYSSAGDSYDGYSSSDSSDQSTSGRRTSGNNQSDLEVPYSETTKTKHAYNVGAL